MLKYPVININVYGVSLVLVSVLNKLKKRGKKRKKGFLQEINVNVVVNKSS